MSTATATSPVSPLTEEGKRRIEGVLERAARDISFREELLRDPEAALKSTGLTSEEAGVISSMKRVGLEEWGVDVRRFRSFLRDNGYEIKPRK